MKKKTNTPSILVSDLLHEVRALKATNANLLRALAKIRPTCPDCGHDMTGAEALDGVDPDGERRRFCELCLRYVVPS